MVSSSGIVKSDRGEWPTRSRPGRLNRIVDSTILPQINLRKGVVMIWYPQRKQEEEGLCLVKRSWTCPRRWRRWEREDHKKRKEKRKERGSGNLGEVWDDGRDPSPLISALYLDCPGPLPFSALETPSACLTLSLLLGSWEELKCLQRQQAVQYLPLHWKQIRHIVNISPRSNLLHTYCIM